MKTASPALISLLAGSTQFLMADLLTITTPPDPLTNPTGDIYRITTADVPITINGNKFSPGGTRYQGSTIIEDNGNCLLERGRLRNVRGIEVDTLDVTLKCTPADMQYLFGQSQRAVVGAAALYPATTFTQPNRSWRSPVNDGTVFCAVSYFTYHVVVSADNGATWTEYVLPGSGSPSNQGTATDGTGTLLAYGAGTPNLWRSTDHGATWTTISIGFTGYITQIEYNGSYFLAITSNGNFYTSTTGVIWTPQAPPKNNVSFSKTLVWHPQSNKWYVHDNLSPPQYIYSSSNGIFWDTVYTFTGDLNNFDRAIVHNGRILLMGVGTADTGYGPCMLWSDDGINWSKTNIPQRATPLISDGTNLWVGEYNSYLYYSADGVTNWTKYAALANLPGNGNEHGSCYANGIIVCLALGSTQGFRIVKGSLYPSTTFDYANVTLERAFLTDWSSTPVGTLNLFAGRVAQSQFSRSEIKLTVKSWLEILNIRMPRNLYQAGCLNVVYDAGCALNRIAYTITGTVTAGNGTRNWLQGGPTGYADGYFNGGIMTFGAGQNYCRRTIVSQIGQTWTLSAPLPNPVAAGQTFTSLAGCDRTLATCAARGNSQRYRGMPFIPVPEKAM